MAEPSRLKPVDRLAEVVEVLHLTQKELSEDVAQMAQAVTALTETTELIANKLDTLDELRRAVEQLGELMHAYTGKVAELFDEQRSLAHRFGAYVTDTAKQQSGIRQVDERLKALDVKVEERVAALELKLNG